MQHHDTVDRGGSNTLADIMNYSIFKRAPCPLSDFTELGNCLKQIQESTKKVGKAVRFLKHVHNRGGKLSRSFALHALLIYFCFDTKILSYSNLQSPVGLHQGSLVLDS